MAAKRPAGRASARSAKQAANKTRPGKAAGKKQKARKAKAKQTASRAARSAGAAGSITRARRAGAPSRAEEQVAQIQRVIDVMVAAGAVEVELEEAGSKLRVRLKEQPAAVPVGGALASGAAAPVVAAAADGAAGASAAGAIGGEAFKSPMVGTFYRAASPDAEPFVKEGDRVTEESVLCIIEAMKVMNEIKAETIGQVVEILAQNGEPVDYGQPLFVIKP